MENLCSVYIMSFCNILSILSRNTEREHKCSLSVPRLLYLNPWPASVCFCVWFVMNLTRNTLTRDRINTTRAQTVEDAQDSACASFHLDPVWLPSSVPGGGSHDGAGGRLPHGGSVHAQHPPEPLRLEYHHPVHRFLWRWHKEGEDPCLLHRCGEERPQGGWGSVPKEELDSSWRRKCLHSSINLGERRETSDLSALINLIIYLAKFNQSGPPTPGAW